MLRQLRSGAHGIVKGTGFVQPVEEVADGEMSWVRLGWS